MAFRIHTNAFQPGGTIPMNFTGEGANKSPALYWEGAPPQTQSFALIVEDPDAPANTFFHWLVYDIPANVTHLGSELPQQAEFPDGIKQGTNDFDQIGYSGPMPPPGSKHRYVFRLYALEQPSGTLRPGLRKDELLSELEKRGIIARTEITGLYKKLGKTKRAAS